MSNKRQIVVKKTANTCRKNQNRIATQLLLNTTKNQQVEKKIQRQICQLKTNYCRCAFNLFFVTSAFDLSLSNSSSFSSNSSSSSDSSSSDLFAFVLLIEDLLTRDLSTN